VTLTASFIPEEDRLDLSFEGNLDVTIAMDVCATCKRVAPSLRSCIIDLSGVDRVFDSGVALLQMLCARVHRVGALVVILSARPEIGRQIQAAIHQGRTTFRSALGKPRRRARAPAVAG